MEIPAASLAPQVVKERPRWPDQWQWSLPATRMPVAASAGSSSPASRVEESCIRSRAYAVGTLAHGHDVPGSEHEVGEQAQMQQQILHPLTNSPPADDSDAENPAAASTISSFPLHAQVRCGNFPMHAPP